MIRGGILEPTINKKNIKPHLNIERDIQEKGNGLFTFNLRIDKGDIVDYVRFETVTARDYRRVEVVSTEKFVVSLHPRVGSPENAVRPGNR